MSAGRVYLDRRGGFIVRARNRAGKLVYVGRRTTRARAYRLLAQWKRETT